MSFSEGPLRRELSGVQTSVCLLIFLKNVDGTSTPLKLPLVQTGLMDEPIGIEAGKGSSHFVEFGGGAVDFEADELSDFESFAEIFANVIEVSESGIAVGVGFTAIDDVTIEGEIVIKNACFGFGFLDEGGKSGDKIVEFSGLDFEIRMKTDGHDGGVVRF